MADLLSEDLLKYKSIDWGFCFSYVNHRHNVSPTISTFLKWPKNLQKQVKESIQIILFCCFCSPPLSFTITLDTTTLSVTFFF